MSAATDLQAAVVAALAGIDGLSGMFDGPPPRAPYPYITIGEGLSLDWSTKTQRGREHRLALTAWDEAGRTARLMGLTDAIERAVEALPPALPGSRIVSVTLLRSRIVRTPGGPWAGMVDYRVRTLEL